MKDRFMGFADVYDNARPKFPEKVKEPLTLIDLANEKGYSVYHFRRIFYVYQGMAPMEYVNQNR